MALSGLQAVRTDAGWRPMALSGLQAVRVAAGGFIRPTGGEGCRPDKRSAIRQRRGYQSIPACA
ncbi:hypothetical protein HMPREF3220_00939 [Citrobacter koseri]|nr:hypothetical protein HMPREF3220_00939 [Citrobacter koseri]